MGRLGFIDWEMLQSTKNSEVHDMLITILAMLDIQIALALILIMSFLFEILMNVSRITLTVAELVVHVGTRRDHTHVRVVLGIL